jgi:hypothetical protein
MKPAHISRRNFLAATGSAAGLAALTAMGFSPKNEACRANIPKIDMATIQRVNHQTDVLVVGSGETAV